MISRKTVFLGACLILFSSGVLCAEEIASFELDLGKIGVLTLIKGKPEPDKVGRFDKFVIKAKDSPDEKVVYQTEGRILTSIQAVDVTGGPSKDLLLTLDTGGSGGYVDFALLSPASGSYIAKWEEEAIKSGQVMVEDKDGDGKQEIIMKSFDTPEGAKEPVLETQYFRLEGNEIVAFDLPEQKKNEK